MSNSSQFLGSGIKSLQKGVTTPGSTATVTAVDVTKAKLRYLGCSGGSLGASADVVLTNSTTITVTGNATRASWELEESY